jgi:hypothetical protein
MSTKYKIKKQIFFLLSAFCFLFGFIHLMTTSVFAAQAGSIAEAQKFLDKFQFSTLDDPDTLLTDPAERRMQTYFHEFIEGDFIRSFSSEVVEGGPTGWTDLYNKNPDFKTSVLNSFADYLETKTVAGNPDAGRPVPRVVKSIVINNAIKQGDPVDPNFQIIQPSCIEGDKLRGGCGWRDIILLINRIIKFMVYIAASLSAVAFAYAGFLYMTAFGSSGKIEQAHGIFKKTFMGILFVLMGWLLVSTLLTVLGATKPGFSLLK